MKALRRCTNAPSELAVLATDHVGRASWATVSRRASSTIRQGKPLWHEQRLTPGLLLLSTTLPERQLLRTNKALPLVTKPLQAMALTTALLLGARALFRALLHTHESTLPVYYRPTTTQPRLPLLHFRTPSVRLMIGPQHPQPLLRPSALNTTLCARTRSAPALLAPLAFFVAPAKLCLLPLSLVTSRVLYVNT